VRLLTLNVDHSGAAQLEHAGLLTATAWLSEMFAEAGIEVVEVCFGKGTIETATHVTPREAALMLAAGEISAIYTQYIQSGAPFELAGMAWPRVVPIVSVCHDLVNAMEPIVAWMHAPSRHKSDVAVISSSAGAQALKLMCKKINDRSNVPQVDIEVLPLGVSKNSLTGGDTCNKQEDSPKNKETIYLWIGRFSETYKADLRPLLLAIQYLHENHRELKARFVAIGADQMGIVAKLKQYTRELGIESLCSWLPNADNQTIRLWISKADVFVNVSDHIQETFGLANLEAMAAGLPVIASDWSGFRDIIKNGTSGFLIPTFLDTALLSGVNLDVFGGFSMATTLDMRSLVESMTTLGQNAHLRFRMGEEGQKIIEAKYTSSKLAPRYKKMIESRVSMAQAMAPRCSSRNWMGETFRHYSTYCLEGLQKLELGAVALENALSIVNDNKLKKEMEIVYSQIKNGQYPIFSQLETDSNVTLKRMAAITLIKLGVVSVPVGIGMTDSD
jgi:glycosyltransferase involved in cell wall biosynthesis